MNKIKLFNNEIEMGLRILIILENIYPKSFDVEMINYFDYFSLHTKDIGGEDDIHPELPNRFGELSVKRDLIHSSLKLLISKGLVEINYTDNGIEYLASELTSPFLDNLSEEYTKRLSNNVKWVCERFKDSTYENIKQFVSENKSKWGTEISYCTIGLIDE